MTAVAHQHRLAAKAGFSTPRPAPELLQKKPDIEPHSRTRHCAKLSLAGEVGVSPRARTPVWIEPSPGAMRRPLPQASGRGCTEPAANRFNLKPFCFKPV